MDDSVINQEGRVFRAKSGSGVCIVCDRIDGEVQWADDGCHVNGAPREGAEMLCESPGIHWCSRSSFLEIIKPDGYMDDEQRARRAVARSRDQAIAGLQQIAREAMSNAAQVRILYEQYAAAVGFVLPHERRRRPKEASRPLSNLLAWAAAVVAIG